MRQSLILVEVQIFSSALNNLLTLLQAVEATVVLGSIARNSRLLVLPLVEMEVQEGESL
jgi:hypothetical protein